MRCKNRAKIPSGEGIGSMALTSVLSPYVRFFGEVLRGKIVRTLKHTLYRFRIILEDLELEVDYIRLRASPPFLASLRTGIFKCISSRADLHSSGLEAHTLLFGPASGHLLSGVVQFGGPTSNGDSLASVTSS